MDFMRIIEKNVTHGGNYSYSTSPNFNKESCFSQFRSRKQRRGN